MIRKYINFLSAISINPMGKTGVILTTSSFITFLLFEFARIAGFISNEYIGLLNYLVFPSLFIAGLILILFGWMKYRKTRNRDTAELLAERTEILKKKGGIFGSSMAVSIALFTLLNIVFLSTVSFRTLHFMDKPQFCGTACHKVMNPEWVTYRQSPHARVKCVQCHVGEGAGTLISSKLNGMRQMYLAALNMYNRPVPTPVHRLRPARETCEKCHWPDKFYGSKLKTLTSFEPDSLSTPRYTTLNLKIDSRQNGQRRGIHWHIGKENEIRYSSVDDRRIEMQYVEVKQKDGTFRRYTNRRLTSIEEENTAYRVLDCIDCHNRATHIYQEPETAIDEAISAGLIDVSIPFFKKTALTAISGVYSDYPTAFENIENSVFSFYKTLYPEIAVKQMSIIEKNIEKLQKIYKRNIHPYMNITWNTYRSNIGHKNGSGCFRCHTRDMVSDDGSFISNDCTICHSILADKEDDPLKYLKEPGMKDKNYAKHLYLRDEFLRSIK